MSAIRYFDDIPHIVRYGMHDDKAEKCWIWFWRNGVRFKIFVDREDVKDTPFYQQWKPLLREHERGAMPLSQWAESQWHPLCDLLISTAMPTLERLAPEREYWTTLRDYLHSPAYWLRLAASGDQAELATKIEEGPKDTGAYSLEPVSPDILPHPTGIQLYQSQDLHVLNREKDWRRGPAKVSTQDGSTFYFLGCQQGTRNATTQQISNASLDAIRAQLKFMEARIRGPGAAPLEGIPQVCGLITDSSISEGAPGSLPQELRQSDGARSSEQRIAGILLTWIPQGKTLVQIVPALANLNEVEVKTKIRAWTAVIGTAIKHLHRNGVYLGGREDWYYLNQYTLLIDSHWRPWLDVSHASWAVDVSSEEAEAGKHRDALALIRLLVDWLPHQVAQKRAA